MTKYESVECETEGCGKPTNHKTDTCDGCRTVKCSGGCEKRFTLNRVLAKNERYICKTCAKNIDG